MGLFLLESLRITRLFPVISSMDDRMRRRMMVISLTILCVLAGIEASLAYMRDLLALDREALTQSLTGVTAAAGGVAASHAEFRWIPSIGQMVMGFILPFALAFIAIPLESFIHSLRTVLGLLLVGAIRAVSVAARALGNLLDHSMKLLMSAYDLLIMIPLSIERLVVSLRSSTEAVADAIPDVTATDEQPARKSRKGRRSKADDDTAAAAA